MAKAVLELIAQTQGWDGGINKAIQGLNNFMKANGGLHNVLANNSQLFRDAVGKFGDLGSKATTMSGKVRELSNAYMTLGNVLHSMTEAERKVHGQTVINQMRKIRTEVLQTKEAMNKLNADLSIDDKKFGAFGAIFQGNLAASAAMNAFRELGNGIKYAAQTNIDFEQSNATLASILGTTTDKVIALTENAKMLGATTVWTAGEISELQQVLARRGFNEGQILDMTKGISSLATATGVGLADAAELAASAIQAFQLPASQMDDVVATLGVATTKSALDMEKLRYAFAYVAPAAKAAGFSIEEAVSMLGALADAGLPATTAGMATRNILLDMTDSSSRLAKGLGKPVHSLDEFVAALEELKAKGGNNLETIGKLVDDRVVPAFSVFLNSTDKMVTMREEVTNVRDELQAMVDNQINTLQGSITLLTSAWDGLMLSFSGANTPIRKVVDSITSVINAMTEASNTGKLERSLYNVTTAIQAATAAFITYKVATIDVEMVLLNVGIAFEKLGNRIKKLNALLVKHPWVAVASAIAALTVVAVRNKKAMDEVNKSYNTFGDIEAEVKRQYQEQASKVKMLTEIIHDHNRTLTQRQSAIEHLQSIIPDYHASLSEEKGLYDENRSAIDEYNKALERSIRIDALRNKITELEGNKINITTQLNDYQRQGMTRASELLSDPATVSRLQHLYGMPVGTTALDWQNIQDIDLQNLSRQYEALWNQYFAVDDQLRPLLNKLEELTAEQLTTKTTTTTTTTTTTGGDEEAKKAEDKYIDSLVKYQITIEKAAMRKEAGLYDELAQAKKNLSAEESLLSAVEELAIETNSEEWKEAYKQQIEAVKRCAAKVNKLTEEYNDRIQAEKDAKHRLAINRALDARTLNSLMSAVSGYRKDIPDEVMGGQSTMEYFGLSKFKERMTADLSLDIPNEEWEALVTKINEKLAELKLPQIELDVDTGKVTKLGNVAKFTAESFGYVANSITNVGNALQSLEDPGAKVAGMIMNAIASIAMGFAQASAADAKFGVLPWILSTTAGVATMAATIASIKEVTQYKAEGGRIEDVFKPRGTDTVPAMLTPGEIVLNAAGQSNVASKIIGAGAQQQRVYVEGRVSGKDILLASNNYNRARGGSRGAYTQIK